MLFRSRKDQETTIVRLEEKEKLTEEESEKVGEEGLQKEVVGQKAYADSAGTFERVKLRSIEPGSDGQGENVIIRPRHPSRLISEPSNAKYFC